MKLKREFSIIDMIKKKFPPSSEKVVLGIGDDGAIIKTFAGKNVFSTDALVEDVHFRRLIHPPRLLGKKAVSVNVSDINAMGGIPEFGLLVLAIPPEFKNSYLEKIGQGIAEGCRQYGVEIIGGDITRSPGPFFINLMVWGRVDKQVTRSGANPGDDLWVTGTLGDAYAGWIWLSEEANRKELGQIKKDLVENWENEDGFFLAKRHLDPWVCTAAGPVLSELISSMIDISDGFSNDLGHICLQSRVGALIEIDELPLSQPLINWAQEREEDPREIALSGGEDYQLLFSAVPEKGEEIKQAMDSLGIKISKIGKIREKSRGIKVIDQKGVRPLKIEGWDHFA